MHRLLNDRPIDRSQLPDGLEERAAWATVEGLVDLELARRFPPDTDLDAVYAAAARACTPAAPNQVRRTSGTR